MTAAKGGPMGGKGLGALLAMGPPRGGSPMGDGDGADSENQFDTDKANGADDMLVGAAHDVMSSLRARDASSFAVALKDFIGMC